MWDIKYQNGRIAKPGVQLKSSAGLNEHSESMFLIVTFRKIQKVFGLSLALSFWKWRIWLY